MSKIESRIGIIKAPEQKVYDFLSNFNNFKDIVPADKLQDFESTEDSCKFSVEGIGNAGMKIIERDPPRLIKITSDEATSFSFLLWMQIKEVGENDSRIKITVEATLNPMIAAMAQKPLKKFVDTLVDQIEKLSFPKIPDS